MLPRFGIAGMGCGLGFASSIDELEHTIYAGVTPTIWATCSANGHGPRGAAEHALREAEYVASGQQLPIAIVTVQGTAVGDIATRWNLAGPTFDMPNTGWALKVTQLLLADKALEAVLVADGAAAIVGVRADAPGRIYARVDAVKTLGGSSVAVGAAARSALAAAGTTPEQIDHVELHLSGDCDADRQALSAVSQVWSLGRLCRTAISTLGERGTMRSSLLLSLIKAALCLHYGYLPPWTYRHEDDALAIRGTGLFALSASRPRVRASRSEPLRAAVGGIDGAGINVCVVLSGATVRGDVVAVDWRRAGGPTLVPIGGSDIDDLLHRIRQVRDALDDGTDVQALSHSGDQDFAGAVSRVVFCAVGGDAMRTEFEAALALLPAAHRAKREWVTPNGSCYAPTPIGSAGRVALVYPGGLTAYPGLAQDLHRCFPGLVPIAEAPDGLPHDYFAHAEPLYTGLSSASEETDPLVLESQLHQDFPTTLNVGLGFGFLQTQALRRLLGVPVHGALGYSLGEVTLLYTLGTRSQLGVDFPNDDNLFKERLGGPKRAIRELWEIADDVPDHAVWGTMLLFADVAAVRAEIARLDRVFLTHVNTPGEVVVAGDPRQCRTLARALGCASLPTSVSYVLHCPAVDAHEMAAYISKRLGPVDAPLDGVELFSAHHYSRVTDFANAAQNVTDTLRSTLDFPRLVQSLHRRGYRYFIEVGPGATATRWIDEILTADEHLAASVDRRGAGTAAGIARVLARLASHGLPVDLSRLTTIPTSKEIPCPTP